MLHLSPRLLAILDLVAPGTVLADIGTDHAYVPAKAVLSGISPRAIASDINQDPIRAAGETLSQHGLRDLVALRLGPGLNVILPGEAGTIVIAGMGGTTICEILSSGLTVARCVSRLVVQPMIRITETREWLVQHDFTIIDERTAREGRHLYQIIAAEPRPSSPLTALQLEYGPVLLMRRDPLLREILRRDLLVIDAAISGLRMATDEGSRLIEFLERRERITGLLSEW